MKPQSSERKIELGINLMLIVTDRKTGLTYFLCSDWKGSYFCVEHTEGVTIVRNCKYSVISIWKVFSDGSMDVH